MDARDIITAMVQGLAGASTGRSRFRAAQLLKISHGKINSDWANWEAVFKAKECLAAGSAFLAEHLSHVVNLSGPNKLRTFTKQDKLDVSAAGWEEARSDTAGGGRLC